MEKSNQRFRSSCSFIPCLRFLYKPLYYYLYPDCLILSECYDAVLNLD